MTENDRELDFIGRHLQAALPPWRDENPQRDLWPEMLRRMQQPPLTFGWFEAALVGAVVVSVAAFPELLPVMLFHL
jgi:hypothetical protein